MAERPFCRDCGVEMIPAKGFHAILAFEPPEDLDCEQFSPVCLSICGRCGQIRFYLANPEAWAHKTRKKTEAASDDSEGADQERGPEPATADQDPEPGPAIAAPRTEARPATARQSPVPRAVTAIPRPSARPPAPVQGPGPGRGAGRPMGVPDHEPRRSRA